MRITKMKSVARSYVWWTNLDNDIANLANSCSACLYERPNPLKACYITGIILANVGNGYTWTSLVLLKKKCTWLLLTLTLLVRSLFLIASTSAKAAIKNLRELFSSFGNSDNGPPFNSVEFKQFLKYNDIFKRHQPLTTPNNMVRQKVLLSTLRISLNLHLELA